MTNVEFTQYDLNQPKLVEEYRGIVLNFDLYAIVRDENDGTFSVEFKSDGSFKLSDTDTHPDDRFKTLDEVSEFVMNYANDLTTRIDMRERFINKHFY